MLIFGAAPDPGTLTIVGGFIVAVIGAAAVLRKTPAEARLIDAQRDKMIDDRYGAVINSLRADLDRHSQELSDLRGELAAARDDALAARTAESTANLEVANVRAQLAEALQRSSEERHAMRNEFNAKLLTKDMEIRDLRGKIAALVREVGSLRAGIDPDTRGRRHDDGPESP